MPPEHCRSFVVVVVVDVDVVVICIVCYIYFLVWHGYVLRFAVLFTGDHSKQDLWYTQKPIHSPIFTNKF